MMTMTNSGSLGDRELHGGCVIRLFAGAAEAVGMHVITVGGDEVETCSTIGDVAKLLSRKHPNLHGLVQRSRWAVADRFVDLDFAITFPAEVALIPPVSGG
jgi:molybdopterin converting factor small subunit